MSDFNAPAVIEKDVEVIDCGYTRSINDERTLIIDNRNKSPIAMLFIFMFSVMQFTGLYLIVAYRDTKSISIFVLTALCGFAAPVKLYLLEKYRLQSASEITKIISFGAAIAGFMIGLIYLAKILTTLFR